MKMTGAEWRRRRWARCRWPHEILSPEEEAEITARIGEWRPFIRKRADRFARGNALLASEIEQLAMIRLWRLGSAGVAERSPGRLRALLRLTIAEAYRNNKAA